MKGPAQHRQDTLRLPNDQQLPQQICLTIKGFVISGESSKRIEIKADDFGCQASARQAHIGRHRDRAQPSQHVARLVAGKHGVLVGQIDRRDTPPTQRTPHGARLDAGAYQHCDIGRTDWLQSLASGYESRRAIIEQADDALGT